jgi:chromosome segregation ATPase
MSKQVKKSEKENLELKKKCEQTDVALLNLADERSNLKKQVDQNAAQKKRLEDLCRVLQTERTQLRAEIEKYTNVAVVPTEASVDAIKDVNQ